MIETHDSDITPISLVAYLMGRDVRYASEYTSEVAMNAMQLIPRVNGLLQDLGIATVVVTSGWRPPSLNATISNAAPRSLHMVGRAVDIADADGKLYELIYAHHPLLNKYELWMEHGHYTKGWVHLDIGNRRDRDIRVFTP